MNKKRIYFFICIRNMHFFICFKFVNVRMNWFNQNFHLLTYIHISRSSIRLHLICYIHIISIYIISYNIGPNYSANNVSLLKKTNKNQRESNVFQTLCIPILMLKFLYVGSFVCTFFMTSIIENPRFIVLLTSFVIFLLSLSTKLMAT